MTRRPGRLVGVSAAGLALVAVATSPAAALTTTTTTTITPQFTCQYTVDAVWPNGFQATLSIRNNGPATTSWTAGWTFREATSDLQVWLARTVAASPAAGGWAEFASMPWNGVIQTGGTQAFGWTARALSTSVPGDVTVNGQPCPTAGSVPSGGWTPSPW